MHAKLAVCNLIMLYLQLYVTDEFSANCVQHLKITEYKMDPCSIQCRVALEISPICKENGLWIIMSRDWFVLIWMQLASIIGCMHLSKL